ncbi:hypothetical protein AMECASPLE_007673 [Ameca splendens]|uniref:Uncharacterized protein n=1 Tax=Ameca splendens TaxID=208324 RepID=A0ABV0ZM09_9TELE
MASGFNFSFFPVHECVCMSLSLSVAARTKMSSYQTPCSVISMNLIYHTHTHARLLDSAVGWNHKTKAPKSRAPKKTQGCFSPTKRAINSVSQEVTHLSGSPQSRNGSLYPPAIRSQFLL